MSIKEIKKAIKKDSNFVTISCKNGYVFCGDPQCAYCFKKDGIVIYQWDIRPISILYTHIKRVVING